ncbi:hypothetical protein GOP47_0015301 [Adiantum capillus-veneris]|uniref:Uncharacterized protein n=1 Tax=Adiantum capillus-veneris TaxID=13818 RepID=A0A9D4UJI5_ADICA|nr:hypothetical protein GOP47_0015301 [Adiantum capillus-veneris]
MEQLGCGGRGWRILWLYRVGLYKASSSTGAGRDSDKGTSRSEGASHQNCPVALTAMPLRSFSFPTLDLLLAVPLFQ